MNLKAQRAAAMKAAQDIIEQAKAAGRDLTDDEMATVDEHIADVNTLDEKIEKAAKSAAMLERVAAVKTTTGGGDDDEFGPLTRDAEPIFGRKDAGQIIARKLMTATGPGGRKAMPTSVAQTVPLTVDQEPVAEGGRQDTIFDILPMRPTEAPSWMYRRAVRRELQASIVGTGELKPTSVLEFDDITGKLSVFATIAGPLSEQTLLDYPQLVSFIESELLAGIRLAVEDQVFSGTGDAIMSTGDQPRQVGENFQGILNTTGVLQQDAAADGLATIAIAASRLEADGYQLSGIAMHPSDWVKLATKRNASGGFDLGGAVDPAARTIWGHAVRMTRGLPEGKALAIAKEAAAIRSGREGMDVRAIAINDDMARNQVRVRVEGRFALDIYRPSGMCVIDLSGGGE